jgi:hypothetical protein
VAAVGSASRAWRAEVGDGPCTLRCGAGGGSVPGDVAAESYCGGGDVGEGQEAPGDWRLVDAADGGDAGEQLGAGDLAVRPRRRVAQRNGVRFLGSVSRRSAA